MLSRIGNRKKIILSTLFTVLLIWGVQGNLSYASNVSFFVQPTATPSSVPSGEDFTLSFTVQSLPSLNEFGDSNENKTAKVVTLTAYRVSSTGNDERVGIALIQSLRTLATEKVSITVTAPSVTTETDYSYEVRIESSSPDGSDTNTDDNTSDEVTVTVTVTEATADLTISPTLSVSPSYSVIPGGSVTLIAAVSNIGDAAAPSTTFHVYSSNTGLDTDPGKFEFSFTDNIPAKANQQNVSSSQVQVPNLPGTYYYRVQIDDDRTKTTRYTAVTVTNPVDLSVDTPTVDKSTVAPGETFTLSTTVRNVGTGNFTGTTPLRYFRSADTTLDRTSDSDTQVGTDTISSTIIASYGTTSESITLTAPSEPGTYYYYAYVVPVQGEGYNYYSYYSYYNYYSDIANNTSDYVAVTVSAPPDLTVSLYRPRQATFAPG